MKNSSLIGSGLLNIKRMRFGDKVAIISGGSGGIGLAVAERTHSWLNKYRALLVRWKEKVANCKALLFLACAQVVWKRSIIFGQTLIDQFIVEKMRSIGQDLAK